MIISREEVYVAVWKIPGKHLAQRYGISDVALGKLCRRHKIPRPSKGYWAQKEHPLPRSLPKWNGAAVINIRGAVKSVAPVAPLLVQQLERLRTAKHEAQAIEDCERVHPQVGLLATAILKQSEDSTGRMGDQREGATRGVLIGHQLVTRGLKFLNVLFTVLDALGCKVTVAGQNEEPRGLIFHYLEGRVTAQLIEEVRRTNNGGLVNQWSYKLTGRLAFKIYGIDLLNTRLCWRDTKYCLLENIVSEVAAGVLMAGSLENERFQRLKKRRSNGSKI